MPFCCLQLLRQSGVEQYNPLGDPFDPNRHMAMFEVPDPTKEAGTVAVVTKVSLGVQLQGVWLRG
jgi:molecular chaperone GrpE